jgi:hypothetical protein
MIHLLLGFWGGGGGGASAYRRRFGERSEPNRSRGTWVGGGFCPTRVLEACGR